MKGIVISTTQLGPLGHGPETTVKRLLIPEKNNLAIITTADYGVAVQTDFKIDYKKIKEVEIPNKLVEKAVAFVNLKKELDSLKGKFEAIINS